MANPHIQIEFDGTNIKGRIETLKALLDADTDAAMRYDDAMKSLAKGASITLSGHFNDAPIAPAASPSYEQFRDLTRQQEERDRRRFTGG